MHCEYQSKKFEGELKRTNEAIIYIIVMHCDNLKYGV